MNTLTMMRELPSRARAQLLARVEAAGIRTQEADDVTEFRKGFHRDGVVFRCGVLAWCSSSPVDSVVHEAMHAAELSQEKRARWWEDDMDRESSDEGAPDNGKGSTWWRGVLRARRVA